MQARCDDTGRALFEVARWKFEQVFEDGMTQHGIYPVAGMQDEILAHPGQQGGEHHEHGQGNADHDQGALGAVDDNLVDDHLGKERRHQAQATG